MCWGVDGGLGSILKVISVYAYDDDDNLSQGELLSALAWKEINPINLIEAIKDEDRNIDWGALAFFL